jgi:raffinose/stachyose/melibiose transport system substrate-binding protein
MFAGHGRKWAAAVVAAGLLAASGCSSSSSSGPEAGNADITADPSAVSGKLTFATWWAYANQDLIDGFKDQYPNVDVELQFTAIDDYPKKLQAQASAGDLPDVFAAQSATLAALSKAGQLYDLQDAMLTAPYDGATASWGETFDPVLLSGANADMKAQETDGQTYGVPFNAISVAGVYNKEIFDEVGIKPPASFDDMVANCKALDAAGYIPMSLTGATWGDWWPRMAWDQTMRDDDAADFKADNPDFVHGFELVKELADAGCWDDSQVTTDIAGETSLFLQKKTAQFVTVPENFLADIVKDADFDLGSYTLPALDGVEPAHVLGGGNANVLVISKDSDNAAAAVAFAKYLTSEGVQGELAKTQYTIPSITMGLETSSPLIEAYTKAAANGFIDASVYLPNFSVPGQTTFLTEVVPQLILGKMTPEQAAEATAPLFDQG